MKLNGKNGFIDSTGKIVIAPRFSRACWVSDFSEGLAAVYLSDNSDGGYIDSTGQFIIAAGYNYVGSFSEGLALVQPKESKYYGYINKEGKIVIEPKYELSLPFREGIATVKLPSDKPSYLMIDKNGKAVSGILEYAFVGILKDGLAGVESYDHLWGFVNRSGKEVISPKYSGTKLFHNGLARMQKGSFFKGVKTVYIDPTGKIVWAEK